MRPILLATLFLCSYVTSSWGFVVKQKRVGVPLAGPEKRSMTSDYEKRGMGLLGRHAPNFAKLNKRLPAELEAFESFSKRAPSSCSGDWAKLPHSTMCDYDDSGDASDMGVSDADKQEILTVHNKLREQVVSDDGVSPADMQKMYWDDQIAALAQKWVQVCISGHDKNNQRKVPGYGIPVGQNWAAGQQSWTEAIEDWYAEVKDFTFKGGNDLHKVGHFTQVVKNDAARVGCGFAKCSGRPTYVCDYAFGNANPLGEPYTEGGACSKCGSKCAGKLCDCGGKICMNGGTLDLASCSCTCASVYGGDTCDKADCAGVKDPDHCGQEQPYGYPKSFCDKFANVPEECPVMCGICP